MKRRIVILNSGQAIEDLDLWPGDEVWMHDDWGKLGTVNDAGAFVSCLEPLH